ncbi:MAG TPA: hypothetical protein HPP97_12780 [Desulfuromonadales bacterium]|nr:hypothetical protein [Desulfuromonadales bacterium]
MKLKTKVDSADCKCYRPGDPEFETLANLVTPLHKIRTELYGKQTLYHEENASYGWRRNESVNALYSGDTLFNA